MEELYTPQEVADKFRVTLRTVYQWIKDGKLKAIKVGTLWRISKDSLEEFIRESTHK
ncbi:MAG: helix-turn-helix domain-containing protein [Thermoanaerobacteraceae bacterium]|nr:helix-turn-helix domain-containing protein [Thermoanaerobacteraceae bacterium]